MGIFDSHSSSTSNQFDQKATADGGGLAVSRNEGTLVYQNVADEIVLGTLNSAEKIFSQMVEAIDDQADRVIDSNDSALKRTVEAQSQATEAVGSAYKKSAEILADKWQQAKDGINSLVVPVLSIGIGAVVLVVGLVVALLRKKKGGKK